MIFFFLYYMSEETGYIAAGIFVFGCIAVGLNQFMKKNANRNDPDPAFWPEIISSGSVSEKSRSRRSNSSSRSRSKSEDSKNSGISVIGSEKGEGEARGRRKRTKRRTSKK